MKLVIILKKIKRFLIMLIIYFAIVNKNMYCVNSIETRSTLTQPKILQTSPINLENNKSEKEKDKERIANNEQSSLNINRNNENNYFESSKNLNKQNTSYSQNELVNNSNKAIVNILQKPFPLNNVYYLDGFENNNNNNNSNNNNNHNTSREEANDYRFKSNAISDGIEYEQPIIRPRIVQHLEPVGFNSPVMNSANIFSPTIIRRRNPVKSIVESPWMPAGLSRATLLPQANMMPFPSTRIPRFSNFCPCASQIRCPPCGILPSNAPVVNCPCAPPINCRKCPPLSLVHEIASRRALQDQRLASELQNLSNAMTKMFKNISRFAGDVLKYELEAKEASLRMEEASLKAQLSRQQMVRTSDKARLVAKNSLMHPCVVNCGNVPSEPGEILGMSPNTILGSFIDDSKIFPQEVDSIGEFMKDTFSTNITGFKLQDNEAMSNSKLETESEGSITVEPLGSEEIDGNKTSQSNQKGDSLGSRKNLKSD